MNQSPLDYQEVTDIHLDCQEERSKESSESAQVSCFQVCRIDVGASSRKEFRAKCKGRPERAAFARHQIWLCFYP
jgi:hypothetical protein